MSQGFYKNENGELFHGPNYVIFPTNEELNIDLKDTYTYPVYGWYYFDSEEEARIFFNLPKPIDESILNKDEHA